MEVLPGGKIDLRSNNSLLGEVRFSAQYIRLLFLFQGSLRLLFPSQIVLVLYYVNARGPNQDFSSGIPGNVLELSIIEDKAERSVV